MTQSQTPETEVEEGPGSLMTETLRLLKNRDQTLPNIYLETGIPFYWLRKFSANQIAQPSVNRIQKLYEYLSGKKLLPEAQP